MKPNYDVFHIESGWGDPNVLRTALNSAWMKLLSASYHVDLSKLRSRCEEVAPDTEDFGSVLGSSALDAAVAVMRLMDLIEDRSPAVVAEIASLARDTVDMYVQEIMDIRPGAKNREEKNRTHALMQRELGNQREDLFKVRSPFDKFALREHYSASSRGSLSI
jgi:uncharacterized protein YjaG (DUF416 family)